MRHTTTDLEHQPLCRRARHWRRGVNGARLRCPVEPGQRVEGAGRGPIYRPIPAFMTLLAYWRSGCGGESEAAEAAGAGLPARGASPARGGRGSISGLWREFRDQSPIMTQDRHCQGPWVNVRDNGGEHDHGASPLSGRLSGGSGCCKVKLWRPGGETLPRFPETSRFPEGCRLWRGVFPALARSLVVARSVLRT